MTMGTETKELQHQQGDEPRQVVGVRRQIRTIIRGSRIRGLNTTMIHLITIAIIPLLFLQIIFVQRSSSSSPATVIDDLLTILPPNVLLPTSVLSSFLQQNINRKKIDGKSRHDNNKTIDHAVLASLMSSLSSQPSSPSNNKRNVKHTDLDLLQQYNRTITPRAWGYWTYLDSNGIRSEFPCFNPGDKLPYRNEPSGTKNKNGDYKSFFPLKEKAFYTKDAFAPQKRPTRGLLFVKPMKVGGSTTTGISLRISRNTAVRQNKTFPMCENSYDHARGTLFRNRHVLDSFLWTMLRDPTDRAISYFFHHIVSRKNVKATSSINFQRTLSRLNHYYLKVHVLDDWNSYKATSTKKRPYPHFRFDSYKSATQSIIRDYQFIGIQERFDESLVALKFLIGVPLGDMLYLSTKVNGNVDEYCHYIQPKKLTQDMKRYLNSTDWEKNVVWDRALYIAANQSLDLTIDTVIGRDRFQTFLTTFKSAQKVVKERCSSEIKPPCSSSSTTTKGADGAVQKRAPEETNCLFLDSACAYECIDEVSRELGLDT